MQINDRYEQQLLFKTITFDVIFVCSDEYGKGMECNRHGDQKADSLESSQQS